MKDFERQLYYGSNFLVVGEGIHKKGDLWEAVIDALLLQIFEKELPVR